MADLTTSDYKAALRNAPDLQGLIKWANMYAPSGHNKIMSLLDQAAKRQWPIERFLRSIRSLTAYKRYVNALGGGEDEPEDPWPEEPEEPEEPEGPGPEDPDDPDSTDDYYEDLRQENVRAIVEEFLASWGLSGLADWVEEAIQQKWSVERIKLELRKHPIYLAAFPENELRRVAGYTWISEEEILAYRDEARRLATQYLGLNVSNSEIAGLVGNNISLAEWERRLETWNNVKRWGDSVRQVFELELGYAISDDRMWAFMNPDIPTPELDLAYERALMRGQPAVLGLAVRPEEEADLLQQFGISAEEAFKGYQGIVQEMPRFEKYRYIEAYLRGNEDLFPTGEQSLAGANFGTLFRALQLGDPDALSELRALQARETARFQAQGGPGRRETGKSGLLGRFEW